MITAQYFPTHIVSLIDFPCLVRALVDAMPMEHSH